jgi:arylsulfatase A-like enzyme
MMGDYQMLGKGVMFGPSVRVPLMFKIPGVTDRGTTIDEPISQIDLVATLLDMVGLPWEGKTQGKSLFPVIRGEERLEDNDIFIEHGKGSGALTRTIVSADGWRLTFSEPDGRELYHLDRDPLERTNLFYDMQYRGKIRELADKLIAWQRSTGDEPLVERAPV